MHHRGRPYQASQQTVMVYMTSGLPNNQMNHDIMKLVISHEENLKTEAKSFGSCQPARTAQADMG